MTKSELLAQIEPYGPETLVRVKCCGSLLEIDSSEGHSESSKEWTIILIPQGEE